MKKYLYLISFLTIFVSCTIEPIQDKILLSQKLENTVWVGDENYQACDCGFSGLVGFKGGKIYELSDFGQKEPTGCFPFNFWVRDYEGKIENYKDEENKISFNIVSGTWNWFTQIEILDKKLKITTSTVYTSGGLFETIQGYNISNIKFENPCK
jgi:hypothetical protein